MIQSFKDKVTAAVFMGNVVKPLPREMQPLALRKLKMIDTSAKVVDLRVPPGNRLEALKGNRKGQHSIRINDQWRVCFRFVDGNAFDVEIVDYH
ncbi:MAG: plasmid maintenance system killer [Comamonadaceae bacterium CG1_02_60_18]|nr:MAG: plasmid maintenance system killer [Comamonadaceae bacterium CG1_02_60_18]PIQ52812.1 MAG: plasmid maintenance system killer [Comamonadaceae bacterium CG12_big_fil_rev_8_21_14_0_65_59_15]